MSNQENTQNQNEEGSNTSVQPIVFVNNFMLSYEDQITLESLRIKTDYLVTEINGIKDIL